jgi:VIT1/CCC1 family predicted Fe2+/Mn2+ transporter
VTSIVAAHTGEMNVARTLVRTLVVGFGTLALSYLVGRLVF